MSSAYIIEIVPADRGWILETIAKAIEQEARRQWPRFTVKIVDQPSDEADLTFFLPESAFRPLKKSITVTHLAHKEDQRDAAALFEDVAKRSDYCLTASKQYKTILENDGAQHVFQIHYGVDTNLFTPKLKLGVVGRTYQTGRKGECLLAEIAGMPMIDLRFTGGGWPLPAHYVSATGMVDFYRELDYLLIPSLIEGGPVPLLEALSAGCPVIAPTDIGLVEDFPHIPFERGDAKDLRRVIENLLDKKLALRRSVLDCDWGLFARRHLNLFAELIDKRRLSYAIAPNPRNTTPTGKVRVLLVTHGSESSAKGGPSTRVRFIQKRLLAEGHFVGICHNPATTAQLDEFDIVHVFNSWHPISAIQTLALAKRAGKHVVFSPIVLDLYSWPIYHQLMEVAFSSGDPQTIESVVSQLPALVKRKEYSGPNAESPIEGIPGHFQALRKCCALADHVVLLSKAEGELLRGIGADLPNYQIIHNGVSDTYSAAADPDLFKKKYGLDKYILCVGRVEYRKNQALLAMAARDIPLPVVLIGDVGDPGYLQHVKRVGGARIRHIERIGDQRMLASAYAGASVFVLPSWCEGAPLAALEAGLVGAPLVLSDMSSEQEYFGTNAEYVSPGDVLGIRAAIIRTLARNESDHDRQNRQAQLRRSYSEEIHVGKTLELYQSLAVVEATPTRASSLYLDVSSLLHTLSSPRHMTGVPLAERKIIGEIVRIEPSTKCIAFNDAQGHFVEIPYAAIERFKPVKLDRTFWFNENAPNLESDLCLNICLPGSTPPPVLARQADARRSAWDSIADWVVLLLQRARLGQATIGKIGLLANQIRSCAAKLGNISIRNAPLSQKDPAVTDFSNVAKLLSVSNAQRMPATLPIGSRVLTLGQGWLSNEPLLDSLIAISMGCQLEAYVYDISYISGAHFSGWKDNIDRQRRLEKLLRYCTTVFTESRVTEVEIGKFCKSRNWTPEIVRTQLRGREIVGKPSPLSRAYKEKFILYVSSFNRRKNHDFIVNVWNDLMSKTSLVAEQGFRLVLVGAIQGEEKFGDPTYVEQLRQSNIHVHTDVSDEELHQLFAHCTFTIFPSLQEGWGIPVQESLMYGKVCLVSSTIPSAVEIDNAALIRLDPHDFFGWREALETWAAKKAMREAFQEQAKQYRPPSWQDISLSVLRREHYKAPGVVGFSP